MKYFLVVLAFTGFVLVEGQLDCSAPDCAIQSNRPTLWPHEKPISFYRCEYNETLSSWTAVEASCQCGRLFSFLNQGCALPERWVRLCAAHDINPQPDSCTPTTTPLGQTTTPSQTTTVTTVPTTLPTVSTQTQTLSSTISSTISPTLPSTTPQSSPPTVPSG